MGDPSRTDRVRLTVGPFVFTGRMESELAPRSVDFLAALLPLEGSALHARWSGEAGWVPLDIGRRLAEENSIARPLPGQVLLYAGERSEPELLIPYGACAFASRAGTLAGNHAITLENIGTDLRDLGTMLLWQGAQKILLEYFHGAQSRGFVCR